MVIINLFVLLCLTIIKFISRVK